jgi:hypothetical protein
LGNGNEAKTKNVPASQRRKVNFDTEALLSEEVYQHVMISSLNLSSLQRTVRELTNDLQQC